MRVIIATFPAPAAAEAYRHTLGDVFGVRGPAVSVGTVGAWGEPYHDHTLVAAWVPAHLEGDVRDLAGRGGGTLHEPPAQVAPPRSILEDQTARADRAASGRDDEGPRV